MQKNIKKKRQTKRTYVYLGLVTMATVSLLAKPFKRGLSALEKHLANASCQEGKKANLRQSLNLWSEHYSTDSFDKSLKDDINSLRQH